MTKAQRYFMEIKDKRVAFIGTGVSHLELIKLFLSKGIRCVVCDKKTEDEFDELIYEELSAKGCEFSLGEHYLDIIFNCDIVFRTPVCTIMMKLSQRQEKQELPLHLKWKLSLTSAHARYTA